jgi:hypothetical protein
MTRLGSDAAEAAASVRRAREFETIAVVALHAVMLRMYCRVHHGTKNAPPGRDCMELHDDYPESRILPGPAGEVGVARIGMAGPPGGGPVRCVAGLARRVRRTMVQGGPAQAA